MAFHKFKKNKNWTIIKKLTSLFMIARSGKKTPKNAGEKKKKLATMILPLLQLLSQKTNQQQNINAGKGR